MIIFHPCSFLSGLYFHKIQRKTSSTDCSTEYLIGEHKTRNSTLTCAGTLSYDQRYFHRKSDDGDDEHDCMG